MLPITRTLGVKRRPHQRTSGVYIAQAAVEIVAIAFREAWVKTQLEEHRTRRTRRRTSQLDAERSAKARGTSTPFAFGWVTACPLALSRLRVLLGNSATLFDIALVEGPLAIEVGSRDAKRTGEDARAPGGGSSKFSLKPGAHRRAHRLTLLTAQVDEPAVRIGAGTQKKRASGTERARNRVGRQTARGVKSGLQSGLQSRLGAAHKGRVSGQDARVNECAQPGVQIRAVLSQGRFGHAGPAASHVAGDFAAGGNRLLERDPGALAGIGSEGRNVSRARCAQARPAQRRLPAQGLQANTEPLRDSAHRSRKRRCRKPVELQSALRMSAFKRTLARAMGKRPRIADVGEKRIA